MKTILFLACAAVALAETATEAPRSRVVQYGDRDVITVHARVRFTTMVLLPKEERILDYVCGDKELWVVDGAANMAYIKPAKEGAKTNLNLVAASGNVYTFVLTESATVEPDLKVFVDLKDPAMITQIAKPRFHTNEEL